MKIKGQESYRKPKKVRSSAPFGDDVAWRRLLTARGRSGAVLLAHPVQSEKSEFVQMRCAKTSASLRWQWWNCVERHAFSEVFQELKEICPNLRAMSLGPIHPVMVYEYAQWGKKTKGS